MPSLNLAIVAHVDAGKTSLTERLLFEAGAIDALGSVDAGTTRTDSMDLERRRGITIRAAVTSFEVGDLAVNLLDTPGHPDFIAEVERSLTVLDAAVLVVSAVEGVQPQTVVLWRALRRLDVPRIVFVNKIDRAAADPERVAGTSSAGASGTGSSSLRRRSRETRTPITAWLRHAGCGAGLGDAPEPAPRTVAASSGSRRVLAPVAHASRTTRCHGVRCRPGRARASDVAADVARRTARP